MSEAIASSAEEQQREAFASSDGAERSFDIYEDFSLELLPEQVAAFRPDPGLVPQGTEIFLTHILDKPLALQVEASRTLHDNGFAPVVHLAARNFATPDEFDAQISALAGAGVKTVLLLGGNPSSPGTCFTCAMDLLARTSVAGAGFSRVYFAGHPEGHQQIPHHALKPALTEKIAYARELGLEPRLVTQFAFDGKAMGNWARELAEEGIDVPVRFGMAGVTSLPKLIKFAMICGVGASLNGLRRQAGSLLKAVREQDPGEVVAELDGTLKGHALTQAKLHFFPFGGWERTASWIAEQRRARASKA
jgi:methylenetetrahydrofolate reductase (NADPH)